MNIKRFLDIEQKYDLYHQSVDGVQYWTYARFSIWNYHICLNQLGLGESHKKKKNSMGKMLQLLTGLAYNSVFKRKIPEKNVDLLFLNHERKIQNNQYYECAYTEKLSEYYSKSVTLEKPYEYRHFTPSKTNNLMYADYIAVRANLYFKISKLLKTREYKRLYSLIKEQMKRPLEEIKSAYSWTEDIHGIYDVLVEKIMLYKASYKAYEKLINKLNPKLIVEVVYYSFQNMLINEIAQKKGIITVELQHGTIYPEHAAYQYAKGTSIIQFPCRIFLFSDFWQKNIQAPIEEKYLTATGYPLFEEKINAYKNRPKDFKRKTILIISQGTIGIYLSELAANLTKLLPIEEYRIIYKLHPSEYQTWKESYPCLKSDKIEVIDNSKDSIYKYFSMSHIQLGVYSTAIYEGLGFGLYTIILRVGHYDAMQTLVDAGFAVYADSAEDVAKLLKSGQWKEIKETPFWKSHALQNMKTEIDKLLTETTY